MAGADLALLGVCLACNLASLLLRALRWRMLLAPVKSAMPFARVWRYFIVGFAVSSVLPGRIGEILRPYLLARDQRVRFAPTFATVVVERVVDLLAVLLLLGSMFVLPSALGPTASAPERAGTVAAIEVFGLAALVLTVLVAAALTTLRLRGDWASRAIRTLLRPLPSRFSTRVVEAASSFAEGIGGLGSGRAAVSVLGITAATWMILATGQWFGLRAFGLDAPFSHMFFLLAVLALGVALPTPAGTGTYHAGVVMIVGGLWGLGTGERGAVAAFAIVSHVLAYAPIVALGAWYLIRDGIRVLAVAEEAARSRESGR